VKLIAEPWDIGLGGYQLGNHPPGFAEWNDRFRDGVRRFWRGDHAHRPELAARLSGSSDIFAHHHRKTWASVNFVTAHDGFTLHDLVSYAERHNEANGEGNRDGHGANYSGNWGIEGPSDDHAICALRERVKRAMLCMVFLAAGTPMLLAGDEMCRTQNGNNNAYCQDNAISWIDWGLAAQPEAQRLTRFTARLIALRRAWPVLHAANFQHGTVQVAPGIPDISWFDEAGATPSIEAWNDPAAQLLALRRAGPMDPTGATPGVGVTLLLMNASDEDRGFTLPTPALPWRLMIDSAHPDAPERQLHTPTITVGNRSAILLAARTIPA
jgi:glycogen operon protein